MALIFIYPDTVTHLKTLSYNYVRSINQFKNLECLNLKSLPKEASVDILNGLPNLKRFSVVVLGRVAEVNTIENLVTQILRILRLDVYCCGIKVDKLEEIKILNEHLVNDADQNRVGIYTKLPIKN